MTSFSRAAVLVSSDRAYEGTYEDKSGASAVEWLLSHDFLLVHRALVPDDAGHLTNSLKEILELKADLVVISGGTGLGPRDITPQTLDGFCDFSVPGFGELLRAESLKHSLNAYLSRCGGWVKDGTLILALPGNPKAVLEQLEIVAELLPHALRALKGQCKDRRQVDNRPQGFTMTSSYD